MLVDDSNEDWWKVTGQGGRRRDPGRHLAHLCPQQALPHLLFRPQRPLLLQPLAPAKPGTNPQTLLLL